MRLKINIDKDEVGRALADLMQTAFQSKLDGIESDRYEVEAVDIDRHGQVDVEITDESTGLTHDFCGEIEDIWDRIPGDFDATVDMVD